jgi:hypothetical protein
MDWYPQVGVSWRSQPKSGELSLWCDLYDNPVAIRTAKGPRPVEVAARVEYQVAQRISAVEAVRKVVERVVRPIAPGVNQFESRTDKM